MPASADVTSFGVRPRCTLRAKGVDLGDVPAGEHDERSRPAARRVGFDQHRGAGVLRLAEGGCEISDFITRRLPTVGIGQMTVGDQHDHLPEWGLDPDAPVGQIGSSDLDAGRLRVVRDDLAAGEGKKTPGEGGGPVGRDVYAILRNPLEGSVVGFRRMPVELEVDAAGPLDHGIAPDGIREGGDDHVSPRSAGRLDRLVHVADEVAVTFGPERIRDGRLEAEQRDGADRRLQQLRRGAARRGRYGCHHLLGALAAKRGQKTGYELVHVLRRDVDVRCVVLRGNGNSLLLRLRCFPGDDRRVHRDSRRQRHDSEHPC
ncbi:hypothetical protein EI171_13490 [Bradyrhizobium sp. LCT2]|nr:hypothetical protein EI171_13490 [Bradyrhizobium sp. LCT2]